MNTRGTALTFTLSLNLESLWAAGPERSVKRTSGFLLISLVSFQASRHDHQQQSLWYVHFILPCYGSSLFHVIDYFWLLTHACIDWLQSWRKCNDVINKVIRRWLSFSNCLNLKPWKSDSGLNILWVLLHFNYCFGFPLLRPYEENIEYQRWLVNVS